MRDLDWNRADRITEIREHIWKYLSPASRIESEILLLAGALLQWPRAEASRLGELQFLLCPEVGRFLNDLPRLMRKLGTASEREEELSTQRIRGPVNWSRTQAMRYNAGSPDLYVTAPARRVYQTPENELLVHVLDAIIQAAQRSGWAEEVRRSEPATLIRNRRDAATLWQKKRMLSEIERVTPAPRMIARIRSSRKAKRYSRVLDAYGKLYALVEHMDRQAVRQAVEQAGLVTAEEPILFQLLTIFRVVDALKAAGWNVRPFTLFEGHVHTVGSMSDGRQLGVWYETTPPDLKTCSQYLEISEAHGFNSSRALRPDIVLRWAGQDGKERWLLIECKLITSRRRAASAAARQALADLLLYRRDFDSALSKTTGVYGLGVAWGEGLKPHLASDIMLCTPDHLKQAILQTVI